MLTKSTVGLWCRADSKFYYLETGHHSSFNSLERVKTALVSRDLIKLDSNSAKLNEEPYKQMSYADADERGYEVVPIFLNPHVKKIHENEQKQAVSSPWG